MMAERQERKRKISPEWRLSLDWLRAYVGQHGVDAEAPAAGDRSPFLRPNADYTQELHNHHVLQPTGTGGDAVDNALAETLASVGAASDGLR
jgi:hypothetical protein